jgi:hypothetical protein
MSPRARAVAAALAIAAALLPGCAGKQETYAPPGYAGWPKTTDVVLNYPIPGHMDSFRVPRMNEVGFGAKPLLSEGKLRWDFPEGSAIVKEVYASSRPAPGEKPVQLTIMVKDPKDPRAQGGWLWITKALPSGKEELFEGNFCVTCHANANEKHPYGDGNPNEEFRDYVFFVPGEVPLRPSAPLYGRGGY